MKLFRRTDDDTEEDPGAFMARTAGHPLLGAVLLDAGVISADQLAGALDRAKVGGRRLGEQLIADGLVDELTVTRAVARQFGLSVVNLQGHAADPRAVARVPESVPRRLGALPLSLDDDQLVVAVSDPTDPRLSELRGQLPGLAVTIVLAPPTQLSHVINLTYRALSGVERHVADFEAERARLSAATVTNPVDLSRDAPVVQVVDRIVTQALRDRASDVHIEPQDERVRVRFRIDGAMTEVLSLPVEMAPALASRIKVMAEMNIVETRRPLDGQFEIDVDDRPLDVRVSTTPTYWGEKVVLRLLDRTKSLLRLSSLGMSPATEAVFNERVRSPYGMVICSGPTGSGKTTTLYATLAELNRPDVNVMTVEDPVEYVVPSINQLQISEQAGLTFASGLRAILRQDPDVILVGEVRDTETASIAVQSALTGHLVLSSLHATDASSALVRLADMGVEPFLIAASVVAVVGQRLVRRICPSCVEPYSPPPEELAFYADAGGRPKRDFARGAGCEFCAGTGYLERIGVYEALNVTDEIRQLVVRSATPYEIRDVAMSQGLIPLRREGVRLVEQNITTIAEIMRAIYVL